MTQAVAQILEEAERLSTPEKAELIDFLVEGLASEVPAEITAAQIAKVRRRVAEVEAGEVLLIPGDVALAQVRHRIDNFSAGR